MKRFLTIFKSRWCIIALAMPMVWNMALAQTTTTLGKEFYFSYLPNTGLAEDYEMSIHLTSDVTTSGTIEVLGTSYSQSFTLNANSSLKLDIPSEFKISELAEKQQKVVYVSTQNDITAYAYNTLPNSSDGSMVLPVESLDKEYIVSAGAVDVGNAQGNTQFLVLAVDDNTDIEITFSNAVVVGTNQFYDQGEVVNVTLNRGEVILYQSEEGLTGTTVKVIDNGTINCKKIAVFAGNDRLNTDIGNTQSTNDFVFNQLYAVRDWGKEYFIVLHETRFGADPVLVVAAEDNTLLEISGVPPQTLDKGDSFSFFADVAHYIKADKPISVSHFTSSGSEDSSDRGNLTADPFMMVLSPLKQISNDIVFNIIESETIDQHYLSIVTATQRLDMTLDGVDIAGEFEPIGLATEYSLAVVPIAAGPHRLESRSGAVAHAYGFGEEEGVGYAIGGDLGDFDIDVRNVNSGLPINQICANDDFELSVSAENETLNELYTNFEWDMGDGTLLTGPVVNYRYAQPGNYQITLFASKSTIACSDLNVTRFIEVVGAAIDAIAGPQVICPNVGSIAYELTGSAPDYTYEWIAVGGMVDSSTGANAMVTWDYTAAMNQLRAVSTSPLGCVSDTVFLDISYKPFLEPILPLGPTSVCGDFANLAYYVPQSTGSSYTWTAEGGTIVTGQGTNEVIVTWGGSGNHQLYYTEQSTTQTDVCEGTSDPLPVVVSEEMDIEITTQAVSCRGQNDGSASVTVEGGIGPYTIEWSIGVFESSVSGLAGGEYEVYITDGAGCRVTRMAVIEEPEALIGTVVAQDATCSGATGTAMAMVEGGTGQLTYDWGTGNTAKRRVSGLGEGAYSVTIRDEMGCELVLNYDISVPQPMVISVEKERPCPDDNSGSLILSVSGGTSPYQISWEHDAGLDSEMADELAAGSYKVSIMDALSCRVEVTSELENLAPLISIPNAFSPNGDGDNDHFRAVFNCQIDFRMYIYNQWGSIVFASTSIAEGWDGTYEGKEVPGGDYVYHIFYSAGPGGQFQENVKGRVRLIR